MNYQITASGAARGPRGIQGEAGPTGSAASDSYDADTLAYEQGARGDYSGRIGTTGTGTDNRTFIQAALNAASSVVGTGRYDYLTRRSVKVTLPPGHYWISAPVDGSPSLVVPAGVEFDFSAATIYVDYPATATIQWAAIKVEQYAQVRCGKLVQSGKVAAPNSSVVYDGIRLVATDNHSRVVGYGDSEIRGFQGAGIRTIGAWITFLRGLRITDNRYGVIASHFGDGFTYTVPGIATPQNNRFSTDLFIDDCIIVNCRNGGVLAGASGGAADLNATSYDTYGGVVKLGNVTLENIGSYALRAVAPSTVSLRDVHIEEAGKGDGVIALDSVNVVTIDNLQYNLAGRTITLDDGSSGAVFPSTFLKIANVQTFDLTGFYLHNNYNAAMTFWSAEPSNWRVGGVKTDQHALPAGVIRGTGGYQQKGMGYVGVKATRTTNTNILTSTWTSVPLDAESWDTDTYHDTATNNSRITIPTGRDGKYRFVGVFPFASNTTGKRVARIYKNGTTVVDRVETSANASGATVMRITVDEAAVAGDYFEFQVWGDHGVASPGLASDVTAAPIYFAAQQIG